MVTYFNRKDLVSFGSYLLSEKRKARFESSYNKPDENGNVRIGGSLSLEERLKDVHHADVENWIDDTASRE